ncbi:MAG: hypothetical protein KatS3mg115_0452 [Candidatus Poribacteria bacterium]|nr:MAG: hypothetical protein KatS3mg115_0452 [Candidatus Poribacteria bacterium]
MSRRSRLRRKRRIAALVLAAALIGSAGAQEKPPVRSGYHRVEAFRAQERLAFYTLAAAYPLAESLEVYTNEVPLAPQVEYHYDPSTRTVEFTPPLPPGTRVEVVYQELPLGLPSVYRMPLFESVEGNDGGGSRWASALPPVREPTGERTGDTLFPLGAMSPWNVRGSKTFSLEGGNRREVTPDQSLQLHLDGEVLPGLSVEADLTDQQLPFQPEGTTEELSQLDQVRIRATAEGFRLTLGEDLVELPGMALILQPHRMQGLSATFDQEGVFGAVLMALPRGYSESPHLPGRRGATAVPTDRKRTLRRGRRRERTGLAERRSHAARRDPGLCDPRLRRSGFGVHRSPPDHRKRYHPSGLSVSPRGRRVATDALRRALGVPLGRGARNLCRLLRSRGGRPPASAWVAHPGGHRPAPAGRDQATGRGSPCFRRPGGRSSD